MRRWARIRAVFKEAFSSLEEASCERRTSTEEERSTIGMGGTKGERKRRRRNGRNEGDSAID